MLSSSLQKKIFSIHTTHKLNFAFIFGSKHAGLLCFLVNKAIGHFSLNFNHITVKSTCCVWTSSADDKARNINIENVALNVVLMAIDERRDILLFYIF